MNSELLAARVLSLPPSSVFEFPSEISPPFSRLPGTADRRFDHLDRTPFKVVMACEDTDAGERARRKLDEWIADSHPGVELRLIQWLFDFLSDPESLDIATSDAADADLLIFAASTLDIAPSAGKTWLGSCLAARSGRAITLVTFFGANEPGIISIGQDGTHSPALREAPLPYSRHPPVPEHSFVA